MFPVAAAAALVLALVAAVLELTGRHLNWVTWLVTAAVILVAADAIWGWRARRRGTPL